MSASPAGHAGATVVPVGDSVDGNSAAGRGGGLFDLGAGATLDSATV